MKSLGLATCNMTFLESFDSPRPHPWNIMESHGPYEELPANTGTSRNGRPAVHFLMLEHPLQSLPQGNSVLILSFVENAARENGWRCQGDSTARIFASHFYRRLHCACSGLEYWTQVPFNWIQLVQSVAEGLVDVAVIFQSVHPRTSDSLPGGNGTDVSAHLIPAFLIDQV